MTTAGFVVRDHDLLTTRRATYEIADPIVRFHHLVTRRHMALLEDRQTDKIWSRSVATYRANVVDALFESICRRWVNRFSSAETLGRPTGPAHRDRRDQEHITDQSDNPRVPPRSNEPLTSGSCSTFS